MKQPKTKIVQNFTVDIDVIMELRSHSKLTMIPMSMIVNKLLKDYLKNQNNNNQ